MSWFSTLAFFVRFWSCNLILNVLAEMNSVIVYTFRLLSFPFSVCVFQYLLMRSPIFVFNSRLEGSFLSLTDFVVSRFFWSSLDDWFLFFGLLFISFSCLAVWRRKDSFFCLLSDVFIFAIHIGSFCTTGTCTCFTSMCFHFYFSLLFRWWISYSLVFSFRGFGSF